MDIGDCIICPGCGWTGGIDELERGGDIGELECGACPRCGYENGMPPYRLLTLSEMREDDVEYYDVRMDLFLEAYIRLLQ